MEAPQYIYYTLKVEESSGSELALFAKKVRERPVEEQEQIYTTLIKSV